MNLRRFGGYALCLSALISLFTALWYNLGGDDLVAVRAVGLVGAVLLIAGLPAIQATQPQTGRAGQLGLTLVGIGVLIALGLNLYILAGGSDTPDPVPFASALLGLAGDLLVGWLTIRAAVFAPWVGWLLIVGGVLNFVGGLMPEGTPATVIGLVSAVAIPLALIGFGLPIIQAPRAVATDGRARV